MNSTSNPPPPVADPPPPPPKVLELCDVTFGSMSEHRHVLRNANLLIREGQMVMVHPDRSLRLRAAASMIQGLQFPLHGKVLFRESDWLGTDYDRHFKMRASIGRVFEDQGWIANLNVSENLSLASDHQGRDPDVTQSEIEHWADRFSLDGRSRQRPAFVESVRLQMFQWVRALIGSPALLLLERPMRSVPTIWLSRLAESVNELRDRGTAVLWFAGNPTDANGSFTDPVQHFRLSGGKLEPITDITTIGLGGQR
ncbi:Cell division ATP-binding protein FtsE [Rubripirellula lacrimiformis]|uniref:Cell division ATP-binding protein FtsE n=1 Tax=Rubripirellula lacrimiformis TaxID=1930273 RepID=A0A517N5F0_9BACT|nr:hypothetical protein [Rubripirellula lacrimiformis]QDT02343.1 Cell division ATP-binding protein FtsE [Rubripirellula lacrimiformis]